MGHKTLINGTGYSVVGGKDLIGGTAYGKKQGKVLAGGAAYTVSFASGPVLTLIPGSVYSGFTASLSYNGATYDLRSGGAQQTLQLRPGERVVLSAKGGAGGEILLNGTSVGSGSSPKTYTYTPQSNATITAYHKAVLVATGTHFLFSFIEITET